jgi:hypothetical protein
MTLNSDRHTESKPMEYLFREIIILNIGSREDKFSLYFKQLVFIKAKLRYKCNHLVNCQVSFSVACKGSDFILGL